MRIWSINPEYLDVKGLVAVWREALLAQKVLLGKTKGYKNHPQLIRFKKEKNPVSAIGKYLLHIYLEASSRGYNFDKTKIKFASFNKKIPVTKGQIEFEWEHLITKVKKRDTVAYKRIKNIKFPETHPVFKITDGKKESWEK